MFNEGIDEIFDLPGDLVSVGTLRSVPWAFQDNEG